MNEPTRTCRRCGVRPGRTRYYSPNPGRHSLAGVQLKVSAKQTVGCDECWGAFTAATTEARRTGGPVPAEYRDQTQETTP